MLGEDIKEKQVLDSILDEALDELDIESDDEDVKNIIQSPNNPDEIGGNHLHDGTNDKDRQSDFLGSSFQDLVNNLSNLSSNISENEGVPDVAALEKLLSELQSSETPDASTKTNGENTTEQNKNKSKDKNTKVNSSQSDLDEKVEKIINDMSKIGTGANVPHMDEMGGEIMESMMKEFENMGNKEDSEEIVEGMMKQLISKEIMYEPIKQVTDKFPHWLAEKKKSLSDKEYNRYELIEPQYVVIIFVLILNATNYIFRYGNQYQYFQRIVDVYENDPENFPRLMELLQDVQEYGQPPADIIKELAPDLDLDEDGMPKMDMGMQGLPAMFPGNNNECPMM